MDSSGRVVGLLAASKEQLGDLSRLVQGAGFRVAASILVNGVAREELPKADVWLVHLDLHEPGAQQLVDRLDELRIPVIYDDEQVLGQGLESKSDAGARGLLPSEVRKERERRLALKLKHLLNQPKESNELDGKRKRAEKLWVLAASTGGPEAVSAFLDEIPADLEKVAFLYVQHIDAHAVANLRRVIERHSKWAVYTTDEARVIREQSLYVVSPGHQVELMDNGVLAPTEQAWQGHFKPCIDQVIAKVARVYGARGGAMIFSGMGSDGANSCTLLHHRGGQVWIQSPPSCTVDSMPVSVQRNGCVNVTAEPGELARRFTAFHRPERFPPLASTKLASRTTINREET